MKAKVKETGILIDVHQYGDKDLWKCDELNMIYHKSALIFMGDIIDWEQRRYEISKEMLPCIQRINSKVAFRTGKICSDKEIAETAIRFADELITQLKGE